jgi:hypothetical protein
MNSLSSQTVVEAIAMQLAERRRQKRARHAAYQALARAIVGGPAERSTLFAFDAHPSTLGHGGAQAA